MVLRKCSNGSLSRKKNDSLVIIASTTSTTRGSAFGRLRRSASSDRPPRPALRASGRSRLSTRYCLSADSTSPDRSFNSSSEIVVIERRHTRAPEKRRTTFGAI